MQTDNWISVAPFKAGPRYGTGSCVRDSGFLALDFTETSPSLAMFRANVCRGQRGFSRGILSRKMCEVYSFHSKPKSEKIKKEKPE